MRKKFAHRKYPRKKNYGQNKIPTRKGFGPTKAPAEQWHETHETHDCTRPTKFSTLQEKQLPQVLLPQDF